MLLFKLNSKVKLRLYILKKIDRRKLYSDF